MTHPDADFDRKLRAGLGAVVAEVAANEPPPLSERPTISPNRVPARWLAVAAVVLVLAGIGGVILHRDGSEPLRTAAPGTEPAGTTASGSASIDGYSLPTDARFAAAFQGNRRVVVGRVVEVSDPFVPTLSEEAMRQAGEEDGSANNLVSRRASVEVSSVLRGGDIEGETIALRIFGGEADGYSFSAPSEDWLAGLAPGATIAIFGGDSVTYEDGSSMLTPNHLLFESDGRFGPQPSTPADAGSVTLEELIDLVNATTIPED